MQEGVNGYVATPGGRLWFIEGARGIVTLVCDLGCMDQDPDFRPGVWGWVATRYSLDEIEARQDQ